MNKIFCTLSALLLLSGCGTTFYTEEDFSSVPKVDAHVHINSSDSAFEEQAKKDNFILITLCVDHGDSSSLPLQHEHAVSSSMKYKGKVFYGSTFLFDTAGYGTFEWINNVQVDIHNASVDGAVALKVWKNIGMTHRDRNGKFIMIDDKPLVDILNAVSYDGLTLTGHLGEPRNCWLPLDSMTVSSDSSYFARHPEYHMYLHPEYPSYEEQIAARDHLLDLLPGIRFVGCHLASLEYNVDSLAKRLDRFPNLAVDISARICHLQYQSAKEREKVREFIIKYQDRIIYGTDIGWDGTGNREKFMTRMNETWRDDWKYLVTEKEMTSDKFSGTFTGLKLPADVVDKVYFGNAVKWYNLKITKNIQ
jgi:hypothetical protein